MGSNSRRCQVLASSVAPSLWRLACNRNCMTSLHRASWCFLALVVSSALAPPRLKAVGKWMALVNPAPDAVDTMLLLSDGTVMAANAGDKYWFQLVPDN